MPRTVSIVEARRRLGRLADEVRRTGQPIALTRRGRVVARIAPGAPASSSRRRGYDALGGLRGTVRLNCSFAELQRAIRGLRRELARNLAERANRIAPPRARRG